MEQKQDPKASTVHKNSRDAADIKQKPPVKNTVKEKPAVKPREAPKQALRQTAAWSTKQVKDAARHGVAGDSETAQPETAVDMVENAAYQFPQMAMRRAAVHKAQEKRNAPKTKESYQETYAAQQEQADSGIPSQSAGPEPVQTAQGSQAHATEQGRQAAQKQMARKQAEQNRARMGASTMERSSDVPQDSRIHYNNEQSVSTEQPVEPLRQKFQQAQAQKARKTGRETVSPAPEKISKSSGTNGYENPPQSVRQSSSDISGKSVPDSKEISLKSARMVKTAEKDTSIKTADQTVKEVGTSGQTASAAVSQSAQSARSAQASAAGAKIAAEKGEKLSARLKKAAAEVARSAKSSLAAVLGAGGAVVVVVVILLVIVGVLLASPLGIFFSSEADNEMTLQQAMAKLNTEFSDKIEEIENSVPHDDIQQTGQRAVWKEILTIYVVKTTTDPENSLDVVSMDEEHFLVLQEIFWDMNTIDYYTETYSEEVTVEVEVEDENGETHTEEQTQTVERTRLIITINGKTAEQMAEEYGFNREQKGYVAELLSEEYDELWSLVSVPGGGSDDIVEVALSQLGNRGGQPYWSWYGYTSRVSWCACFVSWCGDQCGYIDAGIMPKFSYCDFGIYWFQQRGQWQGKNYVPSPGDIIFYDWGGDGISDHVGIVESCDGTYVYTIEGNSSDSVRQRSYLVGSYKIMGYGVLVCK